jgi:hypothetical protein
MRVLDPDDREFHAASKRKGRVSNLGPTGTGTL